VSTPLKRTPLYQEHVAAGARMVPFSGWEMPVQCTGIIEEHRAARQAIGLFDVSHMGEFEVEGPGALAALQHLTTNDVAGLEIGQVQYSVLCYPNGTIVDDLTVYRLGGDRDVASIGYYRVARGHVGEVPAVISRTGYTGEDGFELYAPADGTVTLWKALLAAGRADGATPVGLGARDTLRLEMKYALYGNDIDDTTNALEAGLGWVVKPAKGEFIGREALEKVRSEGLRRRLVGIEMVDRAVARHGYPVQKDGRAVGVVTSGSYGPSVDKYIGIAYVETPLAAVGTALDIEIRGQAKAARVARTPFYPSKVKKPG
jgi:aminomethyltransferase